VLKGRKKKNNFMQGERKKLSELKDGSLFVFTDRKKMPCLYNGQSEWHNNPIWLWSELRGYGSWTMWGEECWVIDYGNELPDELQKKRNDYLEWHKSSK
jgi:hypothetical protein